MSRTPHTPELEGEHPSQPEVSDPVPPRADIVEIFRNIADAGDIDPSTRLGRVYYVDDEPLDLAAILRPPAVLQRRTQPDPAPALEPDPGLNSAPDPSPAPAMDPAPGPAQTPDPGLSAVSPQPPTVIDMQAVLAAATAAMAEVDEALAVEQTLVATPTPDPPPAPAPAHTAPPRSHRGIPAATPDVVPDPRTDAAAAVIAALTEQRSEQAKQAAKAGPTTSSAPTDSPATASPRARRWPMTLVGAVVVLALMAGTGWFLARGPLAHTTSTATPTPSGVPTTTLSVAAAPKQAEYAAVIAAVKAARNLPSLAAAGDQASTLGQEFARLSGNTRAGEALVRAQTSALQALGALDAVTPTNVSSQFPALMSTLASASRAVTRARAALPGDDPGTDTAPAVRRVTRVLGPLALDGLTRQVTDLVKRAGTATKTADLRALSSEAFQTRVASEDTAAILDPSHASKALATRASHLRSAAAAIAAMKSVDADHLGAWSPISAELTDHLTALGQPTSSLAKVDRMIATAALLMQAWEKLHAGPDKAALAAYRGRIATALKGWSAAAQELAGLNADLAPTPALAKSLARITRTMKDAAVALSKITPPDGAPASLAAGHRGLLTMASRGRDVAVAAQAALRDARECECTLGPGAAWTTFTRARNKLGEPDATRTAWQSAYDDAVAEAAAVPPDSDKPVV